MYGVVLFFSCVDADDVSNGTKLEKNGIYKKQCSIKVNHQYFTFALCIPYNWGCSMLLHWWEQCPNFYLSSFVHLFSRFVMCRKIYEQNTRCNRVNRSISWNWWEVLRDHYSWFVCSFILLKFNIPESCWELLYMGGSSTYLCRGSKHKLCLLGRII